MEFLELTNQETELDNRMNDLLQTHVDETLHNRMIATDEKYKRLEVTTQKYVLDGSIHRESTIRGTDVLDEEMLICTITDCSYDDSLVCTYVSLPSDLLMLISDYSRGQVGLDKHWV